MHWRLSPFPRSNQRGPIEASRRLHLPRQDPTFHALTSVAPLKLAPQAPHPPQRYVSRGALPGRGRSFGRLRARGPAGRSGPYAARGPCALRAGWHGPGQQPRRSRRRSETASGAPRPRSPSRSPQTGVLGGLRAPDCGLRNSQEQPTALRLRTRKRSPSGAHPVLFLPRNSQQPTACALRILRSPQNPKGPRTCELRAPSPASTADTWKSCGSRKPPTIWPHA